MPNQNISTLLITGCSKGIGRALALKFAEAGCRVYAVGRNQVQMESLQAEANSITPIVADITTTQGRVSICTVLKNEPTLSVIHNAGISKSMSFENLEEDSLRQQFETNYFAPLLLTKSLLPKLKGQRVLNISSGSAVSAMAYKVPYCTSKGAMHHAIECLQVEYADQNIYFANLRPGMVDTSMQEVLRNEPVPSKEFYIQAKNQGALIAPEIVADFAAWVMLKTENAEFSKHFWDVAEKSYQAQ